MSATVQDLQTRHRTSFRTSLYKVTDLSGEGFLYNMLKIHVVICVLARNFWKALLVGVNSQVCVQILG